LETNEKIHKGDPAFFFDENENLLCGIVVQSKFSGRDKRRLITLDVDGKIWQVHRSQIFLNVMEAYDWIEKKKAMRME